MFTWIKEFFGIGLKIEQEIAAEVVAEVKKVKEAAKCGCGRSPTGFCVGLHKLSDEVWALHDLNPAKVLQTAEEAVVKEVKKVKGKAKEVAEKVKSKAKKNAKK
jgi:CDGSH-type Zn-finger protein